MVVSTSNVVDFEEILQPDDLASKIALQWREWNNLRARWVEEKKELRNYLFATDTSTTSNRVLSWSNSTTTPKLTQIRDNLHANYMASLFPNSNFLAWEAHDSNSADKSKARLIKGYMMNKLRQSNFLTTMSKIVTDYIDYGNCFGKVEFVSEYVDLEGETIPRYIGPRLIRVSPFDLAFNPTAASFKETPKIWKKIVNLGDIKKAVENNPEDEYLQAVFDKMITVRNIIRSSDAEIHKSEGYTADGFSNITQYYDTDYVELLEFYGTIYDQANDKLHENRIITVADRAHVLRNEPQPSWLGHDGFHHAGWRDRPDNLYAMGPLDNLVGLQYRVDHLENLKADAWDQVAYPTEKVRGDVEDFVREPGARIYVGEDGDVEYLAPDATALNSNLDIDRILLLMEEMAGAPRQAMGVRTPGEKTAFEVDSLMAASDKIFRNRTSHFEKVFEEPALNDMLEYAKRNLNSSDTINVLDEETGGSFFKDITKEDLAANGRITPIGARHFAERNTRIQNLNQLIQIKVNDPSIGVHLSGKKIAELLADELNEPELYADNVAVQEQSETQSVIEDAEVQFQEEQILAAQEGL